jgi:hypothetical protein
MDDRSLQECSAIGSKPTDIAGVTGKTVLKVARQRDKSDR